MSDIHMTHGKVITSEHFYEGKVTKAQQEIEHSIFTDKQTILKDIIEALSVVSSGESDKLCLEISINKQKRYRLIKRWTV